MEIKLYNLRLKNFKGIKELEIVFGGKNANIYGANATGKTTIFDAFKWLFFNKDSNNRADFNIKTLDKNNVPIHFLEHEVEATLIVDGQDINFKKMLQEKWIKKRGQEEQEMSGHETSYWIDEVPVKKKDYEEKINSLIPESIFKLITDPLYFSEKLTDNERKQALFGIAGLNDIDEQILASDEKFYVLKENMAGRDIEEYKKVVLEKIKKLNEERKEIPIQIDTLSSTLLTENSINYDDLEKEKNMCQEELENIELQMTNIQEKASENVKLVNKLSVLKNELNNLKFHLEVEHNQKYSTETMKLTTDKRVFEAKLSYLKEKCEEESQNIEKNTNRKQELYKKWDEINSRHLEINENELICPTCKREYAADKKEEMIKQFEINFENQKNTEKEAINKEGQAINAKIEESNKIIEKLKAEIGMFTSDLEKVEKELESIENQKNETIDVTSLPEYLEKSKELELVQEKVDNLVSEDTTELQNRRKNVMEQINAIDSKLNQREMQKKVNEEIRKKEEQEQQLAQKVQEQEQQLFLIDEFKKCKVEICEKAINSHFKIVNFKLLDTQINGGIKQTCEATVNGVPYSDVNNAHKIIAGLDIINTLSEVYDKIAPIFIDNRESINELCPLKAQVINLIVTQDSKLKIEVQ